MSDTNEQGPQEGVPQDSVPTAIVALQSSVRRLRIGLIVTSIVTFAIAGVFLLGVLLVFGSAFVPMESETVPPEKIAETKEEIRQAFRERLGRLEVRVVKVEYQDEAPFPFSMAPTPSDESLYVEYSVQGSDVLVAGLVSTFEDLSTSGMVPTQGTMADRMTQEQFERLLAAYGARTKSPLGSVSRYDVRLDQAGSLTEQVTVGERTFPTTELWSVIEGKIITDDTVRQDAVESSDREAFIFREDPATKQFTFLGTEPAETMYDD